MMSCFVIIIYTAMVLVFTRLSVSKTHTDVRCMQQKCRQGTNRPFVSEIRHWSHALHAKSSFGEALVVFVALLIFAPLLLALILQTPRLPRLKGSITCLNIKCKSILSGANCFVGVSRRYFLCCSNSHWCLYACAQVHKCMLQLKVRCTHMYDDDDC